MGLFHVPVSAIRLPPSPRCTPSRCTPATSVIRVSIYKSLHSPSRCPDLGRAPWCGVAAPPSSPGLRVSHREALSIIPAPEPWAGADTAPAFTICCGKTPKHPPQRLRLQPLGDLVLLKASQKYSQDFHTTPSRLRPCLRTRHYTTIFQPTISSRAFTGT